MVRALGDTLPAVVALAEIEIFCSRPHAPTRRVALGRRDLPSDPIPGPGGILLGGVVARFAAELDVDLLDDLERLLRDVERGRRIAQPRLRYRLQGDTIGLDPVCHRLVEIDERVEFSFGERGAPAQQVLGAIYAVADLPGDRRHSLAEALRRALRWVGPVGPELVAALGGGRSIGRLTRTSIGDPITWARRRLGLDPADVPSRDEVQRRYRELLRVEHPDHGATADGAADRIAELVEARRILTGR